MTSQAITGAYAGLLAASSAVVSKYAKRREPTLTSVRRELLPPALHDVGRLLHSSLDGPGGVEHQVARATALSALQTLEGVKTPYDVKAGGMVEKLLSRQERERLAEQKQWQTEAMGEDKLTPLCRYCTLFNELVRGFGGDVELPIEVVNHSARINGDFDPTTNISQAGIDDFQLFLPQEQASRALERGHPLFWTQAAPQFFEETSPARRDGAKPAERWGPDHAQKTDAGTDAWELSAYQGTEYIYERAKFPWNEQLSARVENILRIEGFADLTADSRALAGYLGTNRQTTSVPLTSQIIDFLNENRGVKSDVLEPLLTGNERVDCWDPERIRILSYDYSLKSCLRSSYGIGWEESNGLNVDDGRVSGSAIHWSNITAPFVAHLTRNDIVHLRHVLTRRCYGPDARANQEKVSGAVRAIDGVLADNAPSADQKLTAVKAVAQGLQALWATPPWLVTISSSKRLRYSLPGNSPVDLWALLTWMAPAQLFAFINRAVCQLPYFLFFEQQQEKLKSAAMAQSSALGSLDRTRPQSKGS